MANYPNPTQPIIIDSRQVSSSKLDFYFRRFCFVSAGESTLSAGEYKELDSTNWQEFCKKGTRLYKEVQSHFVYTSASKVCYILETQAQTEAQVISVSADLAFSKDGQTITSLSLKARDTIKINTAEGISIEVDSSFLQDSENGYNVLKSGTTSITAKKTTQSEDSQDKSESKKLSVTIENADLSANIKVLEQFIKDETTRFYNYGLSEEFYKDSNIIDILALNTALDSSLYFTFSISDLSHYNKELTSGHKGVIVLYDNATKYPLLGSFAGVFTNSQFDLNANNPASPVCFKSIVNNTYKVLTASQARFCTENGISFLGDIGGYVALMGGRCQDMHAIDFWYQVDLMHFYIKEAITMLLYNGVNNPRYVIPFNQSGIDIAKATIKSVYDNKGKEFGLITEYAQGYDQATGELLGQGGVYSIDFADYIKTNHADYEAGIYDGFSAYEQVGKYILQVIYRTTLG